MSLRFYGMWPVFALMLLACGAALAGDQPVAGPPGQAVKVNDEAGLFGAEAIRAANAEIARIKNAYKKDVFIETRIEGKTTADGKTDREAFRKWAQQRFDDARVNGVYILITTKPKHFEIRVGNVTRAKGMLSDEDEQQLDKILKTNLGKNPDDALTRVIAEVDRAFKRHSAGRPVAQEAMIFQGRTEAVQSVHVRARVTGFLVNTAFKEGSEVKKDDLLFEIDPRPYQARVDQELAAVNLQRASLKLAKVTYDRALAISKSTPGAISATQLDHDRAAVEEAEARLDAAKTGLQVAKLTLDFASIRAPIAGVVGRAAITPGNLVMMDDTLLTTIVSLDPMYVYFQIDEATLLRIRLASNDGKMKPLVGTPVFMSLPGEEGFPHEGKLDFVNNQIDPKAGTITLRAVFANPRPAGGIPLFLPGMSVRIRCMGVHLPEKAPK